MADRRQVNTDFWFDFDNQTLWRRTPEVTAAIQSSYGQIGAGPDALATLFAASHAQPNHPAPFTAAIQAGRQGFLDLAELQRQIMVKHFGNDAEALRAAFEDFGQGVLFDKRPPRVPTRFIHMMDGRPDTWVGHHRWHAAIRAAMLSGADPAFYLQLLRNVALAWGVQTETDPPLDREDNPGLPADRLQVLSGFWLGKDLAALDRAFVTFRTRAPQPDEPGPVLMADRALERMSTTTRYQRVQAILNQAATDGMPSHEGQARFWDLPLAGFLALTTIYGVEVIAPKGADRGARSGLIKALKGEKPFGPGGDFPQMPLDRPPVTPENIAYIQKWIDDGCPDEPDVPPVA